MKKMIKVFLLIITFYGHAQTTTTSGSPKATDLSNLHTVISAERLDPALANIHAMIIDGAYGTAIHDLTEYMKISKRSIGYAYYLRGVAKKAQGNPHLAEIDFTRCLLINSQMADAYFLRAISKYELGEMESAKKDFQKTFLPGKYFTTLSIDQALSIMDFVNDKIVLTKKISSIARN